MEMMSHEAIILLAAFVSAEPERATRFYSENLDGSFIIQISNNRKGYYSGLIPLSYLKFFDKVKKGRQIPLSYHGASKPESILYPKRKKV